MNKRPSAETFDVDNGEKPAADWMRTLAKYRDPHHGRSTLEIAWTLVPFIGLWLAAWFAFSISPIISVLICVPAAFFLVRLFAIQHDCGHGAFFRHKKLNDWVGRALGVLTLTPYDVWRQSHILHHASSGNLDNRGIGDIKTLTVKEFSERGFWGRLQYRAYRNPLVLFVIGPVYIFMLDNRLPFQFFTAGAKYWVSAMGTNVAIAVIAAVLIYAMGLAEFFTIFFATTAMAAAIGVWLFYIQHQFEETVWESGDEWQLHEAALYGSSHYDLPPVFRWLTANIGIHHVHHLYSRIPFYRLTQVLNDNPALADIRRLTFLESLKCINLQLWDEDKRRLVTFAEARSA
ncbi:fatty acid desaturase [Ahrensia kielensis]|uniref:fatty acid desaturase n=1 Tax=Ahrensia kielensis TaxID=76980 RepID=UPI0003753F9D|nr:fatty acid desaturase [Ahrensia kielensis]